MNFSLIKIVVIATVAACLVTACVLLVVTVKNLSKKVDNLEFRLSLEQSRTTQIGRNLQQVVEQQKKVTVVRQRSEVIARKIEVAKDETDYRAIRDELIDVFNGVQPTSGDKATGNKLSSAKQACVGEGADGNYTVVVNGPTDGGGV